MASAKLHQELSRRTSSVDYKQLNAISSVVMYDTVPNRRRGKLFEVERIIERRNASHDHEYLLKWKGWPFEACSWEPTSNLTLDLLRSYCKPPKPTPIRFEQAAKTFKNGVLSMLKGSSTKAVYIDMDLDVWRYIIRNKGTPSEHRGYYLYEKADFCRFEGLPTHWHYWLNGHGEGLAVDFPLKVKPVLSRSAAHYISNGGNLELAPRLPIEKISVVFAKRACNINNI